MSLTEIPEIVQWPETHYVFVERVGPFMQTAPEAWQTAHSFLPELSKQNRVSRFMSLYKTESQVYRAGFALVAPPVDLPEGLAYERFHGGKYSRFVLKGSYSQLAEASRRVWELIWQQSIALRDDFAIENYVNSPQTTREEDLMTEILIPTA